MRARGRFLEKTNRVFFIILIFFTSKTTIADNIRLDLLNYNNNLKNTSAFFIQTDGNTLEEGVIYIGLERIKIVYNKPQKITIVLSKKRGMYVNHKLKETQYFNTNKSFVRVFFNILTGDNFFENSNLHIFNDRIILRNDFEINDTFYNTQVIYENEPIKLRKIKIKENGESIEIGFFNHNNLDTPNKSFFSLINPYLVN